MDRKQIGVYAGKVWQLLSNNEKWGYGTLKRKSGLKDKELGAALGWLSRENILGLCSKKNQKGSPSLPLLASHLAINHQKGKVKTYGT